MTTDRWTRAYERDNEGKRLVLWRKGDYLICQNINTGRGWWFEITHKVTPHPEKYVGEAATLRRAKKIADQHHQQEQS